jgi:hypothetical protein
MSSARYFFVCAVHGGCGDAPVHQSDQTVRLCPVCGDTVEVWIGTQAPPHADPGSAKRRAG